MGNLRKSFIFFFIMCASSLAAQINDKPSIKNRDFEAVADFINSKRTMDYAEKAGQLKISGDIRAEWLHRNEVDNGIVVRGRRLTVPGPLFGMILPTDVYEGTVNVRFDYKCGDAWLAGYIQMDDFLGTASLTTCRQDNQGWIGSGFCNDFCLKRAYAGYTFYNKDNLSFEAEVGRRPMYTIFDSRIEFHTRFDGLLMNLTKATKDSGTYYIKGGPFIVDYRVDHYAWVGETGMLDILGYGVDLKYSYIDWRHHGPNRCDVSDPLGWRFRVSQITPAYNFPEKFFPKKVRLYSGFLINTSAPRTELTNFRRANIGWYAGIITGEVKKKGDWSLDINYQYVEAQAIPDADVHGIGRGNALKRVFLIDAEGRSNYKGWHYEFLYAITDKLSFDGLIEWSIAADSTIGGHHKFNRYEIDFIQAF